jgi:Flavodoxin-like fold
MQAASASATHSPMPMPTVLQSPATRSRGSKWGASIPILRTQEDFERGQLPETLVEARDAIPLWHGTMPALLKAFLEQVLRSRVALEYLKHGFPLGLLAGRSARLVATMGMPALIYRWYFRAHGVRGL